MVLSEHRAVLTRMAEILSIPPQEFLPLWFATFNERAIGVFKTPEENIDFICGKLGKSDTQEQITQAARTRFEYTAKSIVPRLDALETLFQLEQRGYRTGLISDCSAETPIVWKESVFSSYFDATVFSCLVGMKKPDPRIYRLAASMLLVKPEQCLYVGDGSSQELTGAAVVGMSPVLLRVPEEIDDAAHYIDREDWKGVYISSLRNVLDIVD
jgi:putative hydrolase of the HAD superfamily